MEPEPVEPEQPVEPEPVEPAELVKPEEPEPKEPDKSKNRTEPNRGHPVLSIWRNLTVHT